MVEIKEKTAMETWKKILKLINTSGESFKDRRNKICKEVVWRYQRHMQYVRKAPPNVIGAS